MSLKVALIGASHWHAPRYLEALQEAGARLIALSDPDIELARRMAGQYGCRSYSGHWPLLEGEQPDLVFAMPRHCDAAAVAAELLDTGLPIVFEKPMGLNAAQVAPLVDLAQRRGSYVAVPFILRYGPLWQQAERILEEDGPAIFADLRLVNGPPIRYVQAHSAWMLDPKLSGGGPMRNLGIHMADALVRLAGYGTSTPDVVAARLTFEQHHEAIEDHALATVSVPGGLLASIEAGYTYPSVAAGMGPGGDSEWRIVIGDAYLIDRRGRCTVTTSAGEEDFPSPSGAERYRQFVLETVSGFRHGRAPLATVEDCYRAMRLVDAIYECAGAPWLQGRSR